MVVVEKKEEDEDEDEDEEETDSVVKTSDFLIWRMTRRPSCFYMKTVQWS